MYGLLQESICYYIWNTCSFLVSYYSYTFSDSYSFLAAWDRHDKVIPFLTGWIGPAIGAAASVAGSLLGASSAAAANRKTVRIAREQMAFQERMSNTQYQRATQDMIAAGLNPMLAYQQGGAGNLSGASASVIPEFSPDAGSNAVSSALDAKRTRAEVKNMEAMNENLKADNEVKREQANESRTNQELNKINTSAVAYNTANSWLLGRAQEKLYNQQELESDMRIQDILDNMNYRFHQKRALKTSTAYQSEQTKGLQYDAKGKKNVSEILGIPYLGKFISGAQEVAKASPLGGLIMKR